MIEGEDRDFAVIARDQRKKSSQVLNLGQNALDAGRFLDGYHE